MRLTLYLPGLLLPEPILADGIGDLVAPALSFLLGRSTRRSLPTDWLAGQFRAAEPLPAAVLRKVDADSTATGTFLCLDPVHFRVSREGITLDDPEQLAMKEEEAAALLPAVAPLFAEWGNLSRSSSCHWELQLQRPLDLVTLPLPEAVGQPVSPAFPGGPHGREWRRLIAEAQTVLHAHPINQQREKRQQPLISSLWPWGYGAQPEGLHPQSDVVWASDPIIGGLSALAGIPCLQPPDRFQPATGDVLAIVPDLLPPARALDALAWRKSLLAIEQHWFAPALAACKSRQCHSLTLVGTSHGESPRVVSFTFTQVDLLRFWRRPRPLTALA